MSLHDDFMVTKYRQIPIEGEINDIETTTHVDEASTLSTNSTGGTQRHRHDADIAQNWPNRRKLAEPELVDFANTQLVDFAPYLARNGRTLPDLVELAPELTLGSKSDQSAEV